MSFDSQSESQRSFNSVAATAPSLVMDEHRRKRVRSPSHRVLNDGDAKGRDESHVFEEREGEVNSPNGHKRVRPQTEQSNHHHGSREDDYQPGDPNASDSTTDVEEDDDNSEEVKNRTNEYAYKMAQRLAGIEHHDENALRDEDDQSDVVSQTEENKGEQVRTRNKEEKSKFAQAGIIETITLKNFMCHKVVLYCAGGPCVFVDVVVHSNLPMLASRD